MDKILEAKTVLLAYSEGTLTDEQQVTTALNELNQAQVNKSILAQTKVGKTLSQLIKVNKSSKVVELATAVQKKWVDQLKEQKNTTGGQKRKREETSPDENPAQKRKLEATKSSTKMEKAVRSQPTATKTEKPVAVKTDKPITVKTEQPAAVKTESSPSKEKEEKSSEEQIPPKEENEVKEEKESEYSPLSETEHKVPTPVTDFQGSSTDKKRNKIQQKLWEALGTCQVQGGTESSIVAAKIEEAMWAEYGSDEKKYQAKYRSLYSNLKDELNQGLRNALFTGDLQATKLTQMSHEELANPVLQEKRKKLKEHQIQARQDHKAQASCTLFVCHKCGKNQTTYFQLQTRSADEPMTTFVTCVACGNHWRF